MRPWWAALGVAGLLCLLGFLRYGQEKGRPHAGETVTPHLERAIAWTAGDSGPLGVRLSAKEPEGGAPRLLDFRALPWAANPVARITFYGGEQPLQSLEVALS